MLKVAVAVLGVALAGSASAAGWRSLRLDARDEVTFTASVAAFREKLPAARRYVFASALQDIWVRGTQRAEAQQREYTASEYFQQLDGLGYDEVVTLTDPSGETAKGRYSVALQQQKQRLSRFTRPAMPADPPAPIGPHGEQVRGIVDTGPAYQHSLRTMGQ